ncbi:MAG: SDR family oxidoreductase [Gammaproteobacteria bacterium]|nr:MAG: SDR family oxidoreductase [Gammaproteobacteria bacterium]
MQNNTDAILIFGATSAVAQVLAKLHAQAGDPLLLIARNQERLESIAADLRARSTQPVKCINTDLALVDQHPNLMQDIAEQFGGISKYYFFYGVLPDQKACEGSWDLAYDALNTNFLSKASLLTYVANKVEKETNRSLIIVSSVAGDRGRQSNYIYGASKGALSMFVQGLRNRLQKADCSVTTIKPGFIDTPMTKEFDKNILWATPEQVANDIFKASMKGRDVIYSPWFWRYIMFIIRCIPEGIFKKLSL